MAAFVVCAVPAGARRGCDGGQPPARRSAVAHSASALLIVAAFLVNRNIYNSDNYRYLIFLLTPWALGCGLLLSDLARRGRVAPAVGVACRGGFCSR